MVFNCGISPDYFLDEMSIFEVDALMMQYNRDYQNRWEQIRFISYITALSNGQKLKTPKDLISFNWEEDTVIKTKPNKHQVDEMLMSFQASLRNVDNGLGVELKL